MRDHLLIGTKTRVVSHTHLAELNNRDIMEVANLNTLPFHKPLHDELKRRGLLVEATELAQRSNYVPNH